MKDLSRLFKTLGDETRLRILHVLSLEEVSVTELAEILNLGQSRVSTQLGLLKEALPVSERREGRRVFLSLDAKDGKVAEVLELLRPRFGASRILEIDGRAARAAVARRKERKQDFTDPAPGDLGRRHLPGRTWEGFARALLHLVPPQRVADIGIGDADMTLLLSRFATELFAVDPDEQVLLRARAKALEAGCQGVRFVAGEIESLPLATGSVDLLVASQVLHHANDPGCALVECGRVLDRNGRILVLDLKSHGETWVREKLGDRWLGFSEEELAAWLEEAGFQDVEAHPVARDPKAPHFVTLLATGRKGTHAHSR